MRARHRIITWLTASYFATLGLLPASLNAGDFIKSVFKGPEVTTKEPCVERLAQEIDWLERHVEQYGSVVAKQPDVWGQARLTKHRDELEKQLFEQLNQFHVYLNGTLSRSDQAFLANAFALSASISGSQPAQPVSSQTVTTSTPTPPDLPAPGDLVDTKPNFQSIQKFETGHFNTQNNGQIALEPEIALDQLNRYINHLHELRRINEGDDTADSPGYSLNLVRIPVSVLPGKATEQGYGAEITITATPYLNDGLLPITFRSLVINDLVDQLALPITKISDNWDEVKKVREAQTLAQTLDCQITSGNAELIAFRTELLKLEQELQLALNDIKEDKSLSEKINLPAALSAPEAAFSAPEAAGLHAGNALQLRMNKYAQDAEAVTASLAAGNVPEAVRSNPKFKRWESAATKLYGLDAASKQEKDAREKRIEELRTSIPKMEGQLKTLEDQRDKATETIAHATKAPVGPSSRTRNAQNPIPPSQIESVFGTTELMTIAESFIGGYSGRDVRWNDAPNKIVHLPDVQRFLQSELHAAYDLLARKENQVVWDEISNCTIEAFVLSQCDFVSDIRRGTAASLKTRREQVVKQLRTSCGLTDDCSPSNVTEALAWAILVESALLDSHLKGDMKSIAQLRGCGCIESEHLRFYMPDPEIGERQAFQEYVRCRWPIHVFALDPVSQDQNIGDSALIRRDLQLAVSLAFVSGQMSASNFTKFVRQYESQYETIALNKTVVGFSHGDDTFGWRFAPRFQTPPTQGNIAAFHQTLFGKHKDCDLLQRKIEPGMRECVAVVIMPSFVPYVTFDVRSNWYRLNHHHGWLPTRHEAEPSMSDTMKLSRAVQQMHNTATCIRDANCYRGGDVQLLMQRVHQLDRELPLQTMVAQVPIENTLGGFEMFSNGVTDLAPDLYGWYGGPGVLEKPITSAACPPAPTAALTGLGSVPVQELPNVCPCNTAGTTLFLVGDHFSVHDTKVIAGDQCISDVTLLSRQIMRVTLPAGLQPNTLDEVEYIDVHVATPYGVTGHLHIPYIRVEKPAPTAPPAGWQWIGDTKFGACVCFKGCADTAICKETVDLGGMFALFSRGDRLLLPAGEVAGQVTAVALTLKAADGSAIIAFDPQKLTTPLKLKFNQFQQGVFDGADESELLAIIKAALENRPTTALVEIRTTVQIGGKQFAADNAWSIAVSAIDSCDRCGPTVVDPSAVNGVPQPDRSATIAREVTYSHNSSQLAAAPVLVEATPAEVLPQQSATAAQPTPAPQQVPVLAPPVAFGGTTVIAVPQFPGTTTTTVGVPMSVPVTGQPVPVPVLVPALPAPPTPAALPKHHPCPCKALRFAVPGEAPVEGVPGEELGSIPMQSLKRMLGWSEPVLHGAPGFLDPDLMPAGYMRPLPATN